MLERLSSGFYMLKEQVLLSLHVVVCCAESVGVGYVHHLQDTCLLLLDIKKGSLHAHGQKAPFFAT